MSFDCSKNKGTRVWNGKSCTAILSKCANYLERERDRMMEKILPKRYSLASVDLQPLAIEYVVDEKEVGVA